MPRYPGIAAVLSFIIPGLGQIYNGELGKGFSFVAGIVISSFLTAIFIGVIFLVILWIWAVIDAYKTAEAMI